MPGAVASCRCWRLNAVLLLAAALLSGCLSRPGLVAQSFTFSTPPLRAVGTNQGQGILAVRRLSVAAPFAGQPFIYRTGASSYEQDPYAQFLVPPEESLAEPMRAYLRNSGRFREVAAPGSALRPDLLLEISVSELYGDFRNHAAPAAVLSMKFVFLSASEPSPKAVLADRTFSRRLPLKARTASALMAGWDEALKEIMEQVALMPLAGGAAR